MRRDRPARTRRAEDLRLALAAIAPVAAVVVVQDALAASNHRWYAALIKPAFSPSQWLAAPASVALGAAMAFAFYRVLRCPDYLPDRPSAIRIFIVGLVLDVIWSWLFFAGRHPTAALAAAAVLSVVAAWAAISFAAVDRRAGLLLTPWVLATSFLLLLDLSIAIRNL